MKVPESIAPTAADATVESVMAKLVIAVRPQDTAKLATQRVVDEKISAVPVLDEDGHPIGILTLLDLLHAASLGEPLTAEELMTGALVAVHQKATLQLAAATMAEQRVHRLVVVDSDGCAVGMVSSLDVVRWMAEQAGFVLTQPA